MAAKIVLKPPFYLVRNFSDCYYCGARIPVISIASNKFQVEDDNIDESTEIKISSFIMPTVLGDELTAIINKHFNFFQLSYSHIVGKEYWANHCIYCNKLQGDFYLHSEPGGAFFPEVINEYKGIELIQVQTKTDVHIEAEYYIRSDSDILQNNAIKRQLKDF